MIGPPTTHTQCSFVVYILHSAVDQENMYCILVTLHTLENKLHKCITGVSVLCTCIICTVWLDGCIHVSLNLLS